MFATSTSDPPPGMTWRETLTETAATSVYFSGTEPPKGLVRVAWGLVLLGISYEVLFNVGGGEVQGSIVAMEAAPILVAAIGGALAYKWRLGGPSSAMIEIGRSGARFSRGFWRNPLVLPLGDVRELVVSDHQQDYQVARGDGYGYVVASYSDTARWARVTLITRSGGRHVVACFGEHACAAFHAGRVMTLLGELSSSSSAP